RKWGGEMFGSGAFMWPPERGLAFLAPIRDDLHRLRFRLIEDGRYRQHREPTVIANGRREFNRKEAEGFGRHYPQESHSVLHNLSAFERHLMLPRMDLHRYVARSWAGRLFSSR